MQPSAIANHTTLPTVHEGLGIALKRESRDLYNCIRLAFNPNIICKLMDDTIASTPYYQIQQHELIQLIGRIAENRKLLELAQKITLLGKNKYISVAVDHAYKNLFRTLIDEKTDLKNPSHEIIIAHFTDEAEKLLKNPNPNLESIETMRNSLKNKLYLKPPLSTKMKAAICGIIGALLGAAIGIIIGMVCLGGIGVIPGAIVCAFKGFTTGTAVAIGTVSAGAAIGAGAGFFSAKRNNEAYKNILTATRKIHRAYI